MRLLLLIGLVLLASPSPAAGEMTTIRIGEPVEVGDLRVTVTGWTDVTERMVENTIHADDLPEGWRYIVLDVTVENEGDEPAYAASLRFHYLGDDNAEIVGTTCKTVVNGYIENQPGYADMFLGGSVEYQACAMLPAAEARDPDPYLRVDGGYIFFDLGPASTPVASPRATPKD